MRLCSWQRDSVSGALTSRDECDSAADEVMASKEFDPAAGDVKTSEECDYIAGMITAGPQECVRVLGTSQLVMY